MHFLKLFSEGLGKSCFGDQWHACKPHHGQQAELTRKNWTYLHCKRAERHRLDKAELTRVARQWRRCKPNTNEVPQEKAKRFFCAVRTRGRRSSQQAQERSAMHTCTSVASTPPFYYCVYVHSHEHQGGAEKKEGLCSHATFALLLKTKTLTTLVYKTIKQHSRGPPAHAGAEWRATTSPRYAQRHNALFGTSFRRPKQQESSASRH